MANFPLSLPDVLTIPGIAFFTMLIVQLLKGKLPDDWVPQCTAVLGIVLGLLVSVVGLGRTAGSELLWAALIGFGGATFGSGLWDIIKPLNLLPTQTDLKNK